MERFQLALVAIALLLSLIEGGVAEQFNLRSPHAANNKRRLILPGGGGGSSSSSGSGSSSSSGGGSSSSGSGSGSESSSGSGSGSESSSITSAASAASSTEGGGGVRGWLAELFDWVGGGGARPSDSRSAEGRRSLSAWPFLGAAFAAFVAGVAFVVARKRCRGEEDDDGSRRTKRRWRRGVLARRVPAGDASEAFVEMAMVPRGRVKAFLSGVKGSKKAEAVAEGDAAAAGYAPAPDGLGSPSSVSRSASSSSSSSASSAGVVIV